MTTKRVTLATVTPKHFAAVAAAIAALAVLAFVLAGNPPEGASAGAGPVVNTTDDDTVNGCDLVHCTLREALLDAEAGDTISFNIDSDADPGCDDVTGICAIRPQTALPALGVASLTVDGYTQPGASPNTTAAFQPTDAQIKIVVDGSEITSGSDFGLWVSASGVTVRGLSIVNFGDEGIKTGTFPHSAVIRGNFVGILPDGETAAGNRIGISVRSSQAGNAVGGDGPEDRNVVSGNLENGIYLWGTSSVFVANNFVGTNAAGTTAVPNGHHGIMLQGAPGSTVGVSSEGAGNLASGNMMSGIALSTADAHDINVKGNRIGTAANATDPLPNQENGVFLDQDAEDNTIGGEFDVDEENIIAFNMKAGVSLSASAGIDNYIDPSSTHSNGGLGADLLDDGTVLANDVNDPDIGPNDLMNYPVINSAEWNGTTLTVNASLNSVPNHFYNMFIFVNHECDPSGFGEAERFLVSHAVSIGPGGTASFTRNISVSDIADMTVVTMSASNPESTSEFSQCEEIVYTGPETPSPSPTPPTTPSPTATPTSTASPSETGTASPTPTPTPSSTGTDVRWADLDCSGDTNPVDALKALRADAGLSNTQPAACPPIGEETQVDGQTRIWGDVDCNLALSPIDALKILRFDAGLLVSQETGCPGMGNLVTIS
jgi:CSLREA domain-containing protein